MLPGDRHRGLLQCGRYLLASLTGNYEGCMRFIVVFVEAGA